MINNSEPLPILTGGLAEQLTARFNRAKRIRENWNSKFEECYEYSMPARESFYEEGRGSVKTDKIFDETAVVGVQEFASRLQAGIVPNFARWAELVAGSEVPPEESSAVNRALESVTDFIFEILQSSNFAQEVHESFLDLAVGTACLQVSEGDALNPIRFTAIPLTHLYLDCGPDDRIDHVFRYRTMRASNIKIAFPKATLSADMQDKLSSGHDDFVKLVDCTYRVYTSVEEQYQRVVFDPQEKHIFFSEIYKGTGSNPYIPFRWAKSAGEIYGRGPLMNAMPAIKTCNLTVQMILENAQMSISGMYQMEDDGVVNPDTIQLVPGTIIPVAPGSSGLRAVGPAGNFDVAQLVLNDMRMNIRKALYNDMLGNPDRTPMSATEVSQRMADLSRQIGSAFGRLQAELVGPLLQRVIYILKKQGRINIPTVNNREIKIQSTSPLSRAQSQQDIVVFDRFVELVQGRFGPQLVNLLVKSEEAAKYLADKFGVPERLLRSDAERGEMMAQIAMQLGAAQSGEVPTMGEAGGAEVAPGGGG